MRGASGESSFARSRLCAARPGARDVSTDSSESSEFSGDHAEAFLVATYQNRLGTVRHQGLGDREAEPTTGAGHQNPFLTEELFHGHSLIIDKMGARDGVTTSIVAIDKEHSTSRRPYQPHFLARALFQRTVTG